MSSKVYFADIRARSNDQSKVAKVNNLFDKAGLDDLISEKDLTAIKLHFGEAGNDSHVSPVLVREIVDKVKENLGQPFVSDTNTLYSGARHNAVDHLNLANKHGFTYAVLNAPVIIAGGLRSQDIVDVEISQKQFDKVKIASDFVSADGMIVMSHFKAHEMAGFGGAIKNIAMGCAPAAGKKEQHDVKFFADDEPCISCGKCVDVCPERAIVIDDTAQIDKDKCIGCGECMTICPTDAIATDWGSEIEPFMERMTEYAYGAIKNKQDKVGYINFVLNITPDCDCVPWSDAPIVRDIGILASQDPVAIDKASYDLVNQQQGFDNSLLESNFDPGEDKFKGIREHTEGYIQIDYGAEIGLGSSEYELIEL